MDLLALQGRALTRTVDEVRALLADGEAPASALRALEAPRAAGLWGEHGTALVATEELVALVDRLPNQAEALPAVFSLVAELRAAWLRVVRGRLCEMGERADVAALVEAVTTAAGLAGELVTVVAPSLDATPFGELERAILPTAGHEAPAFPVLLRALAATASLASGSSSSVPAPPEIAWDDPSTAWKPGRLLRMPSIDDAAASSAVLSGALDQKSGELGRDALGASSSVGLLARPDGLYEGGVGSRACFGRHRLRA